MIELKNIYKHYNTGNINEMCLFQNFNLNIKKGEFVSVIGSNGSGKTSLLNIICGSISIDKGELLMNGKNISKLPEHIRNKKIGRVYQNTALGTCPNMTILENLSLFDNKQKSFDLSFAINKKRIDYYKEILSSLNLGLEEKLNTKVKVLSGGQRQALSLIMSTLTKIELLILDEHTAALDPKTADIIMELTKKIIEEKHLTALMVTHNLRYAIDYGNRLIMMHDGNIIIDKSGDEKKQTSLNDILGKFNEISIECGN